MRIGELKGNPRNPRKISAEQSAGLKASLEEFGDLSGIFFNRRTERFGGGHQRGRVFPQDAEIVIERQCDPPTQAGTVAEGYVLAWGERHKYREVDWPSDREEAANIAANRHGGEWEDEKLGQILADLDEDLRKLTGFSDDEIDRLAGCPPDTGDPDAVPEPPKVAKTKRGELWILGEHRVLCGDATDRADVVRLMAGEKADMVFTDPPYGMDLDTDYSKLVSPQAAKLKNKVLGKKYAPVIGDDTPYDPRPLLATFESTKEVFLWGGDYYHLRLPDEGCFLVWDKSSEAADEMIGSSYELCWSKQKHKKAPARIFYRGAFGAQAADGERCHPTQKPVRLAEWFFERWGKETRIVWDGYLGSGSTLIACEKTQRRCFGMEIEPQYIDVILNRWATFAGKDPIREDGAKWSEVGAA